ncbi:Methyltransferase domain protein [anaerobic digester metagenome]
MHHPHVITQVEETKWQLAQKFELQFAQDTIDSGDDWNKWWSEKFDHYDLLKGQDFPNVLEVGCGPHTNIKYIIPLIKFEKIWLEDPLIQYYVSYNLKKYDAFISKIRNNLLGNNKRINYCLDLFSNLDMKVDLSSAKLEKLPYQDGIMNLIICINVLDHVTDLEKCLSEISRVLAPGGFLLIGQDLSNEDDYRDCPESYNDIGHPIKIDFDTLNRFLSPQYHVILGKILSREEGRNPQAHYGTYIGILKKN